MQERHTLPKAKEILVESRINDMRILGMPVQFVLVVTISLALTIYFGAWAADARIQERVSQVPNQGAQQFDFSSTARTATGASASVTGLSGGLGQPGAANTMPYSTSQEAQGWERYFLFACPLH